MSTRLFSGLVLTALFWACAPAVDAPLSDHDRQAVASEVEAAVAGLTAAMNAHDGDAVVSFYTDDDDFVYLGCTSFMRGGEAFKETVKPYYSMHDDVTFEQTITSLRVLSANAAVAILHGGSTEAPHLFWTQVWERGEDGRWVIVREHESWPGCSEPPEPHPFTGGMTPEGMVDTTGG